MSVQLPDFSFDKIYVIRDKGDTLFRKRRILFIRSALALPPEQLITASKVNDLQEVIHPIQELHLEKTDTPALYEKVMNSTKFQELCNIILRLDSQKLLQNIQTLLKDHQATMPSDVSSNIHIIAKYVVQFQKRIQMTLKTSFEECNDVTAVQEKARDVLTKAFKEGFIYYIMPALLAGVKSTPNYYITLIGLFSDFLEQYGIYTQLFNINQVVDYELLNVTSVEKTDNESLNEKIADLLVLPYFFNDQRYEGQALLCEGQCVARRFEN